MGTVRKQLLKYGITTAVAGLFSFLLIHWRYPGADAPAADKYHVLCDAFTVPAVLLLGVGVLIWVSSEGAFIGVGWAMKYALLSLIPGRGGKRESYPEYRARKIGEPSPVGYGFLFLVGFAFLAVAIVFLILYSHA